jgi:hypothetical protein
MWNTPTEEQLRRIPQLFETEGQPLEDRIIHLHFLLDDSDWYVAEYDGEDTFFGYVIRGGDRVHAEWGFFSYHDLRKATKRVGKDKMVLHVDCDLHWQPRKASEVGTIRNF